MNENLFKNAVSSLVLVTDFYEFIETGTSFIVDAQTSIGCPKETAAALIIQCGLLEECRASNYLKEIEHLGLSEEFEKWSGQDEVIAQTKTQLLATLKMGLNALNHPHCFH